MNEQNKAKVSALMDGELDDLEIRKLLEDKSIKQYWQRYHIISDVFHNHTPLHTDTQLCLRISEMIRDEPAILAPTPTRITRPLQNYLKPVAGAAIAASVAAMVILGVQNYTANTAMPNQSMMASNTSTTPAPIINQPRLQMQYANSSNLRPAAQTVNYATVPTVTVPVDNTAMQANLNSIQMSRYILNHNEYQSGTSIHGAMPHVRLVATERRR